MHPEGPAVAQLDQVRPWFSSVPQQILAYEPRPLHCGPPYMNFSIPTQCVITTPVPKITRRSRPNAVSLLHHAKGQLFDTLPTLRTEYEYSQLPITLPSRTS